MIKVNTVYRLGNKGTVATGVPAQDNLITRIAKSWTGAYEVIIARRDSKGQEVLRRDYKATLPQARTLVRNYITESDRC